MLATLAIGSTWRPRLWPFFVLNLASWLTSHQTLATPITATLHPRNSEDGRPHAVEYAHKFQLITAFGDQPTEQKDLDGLQQLIAAALNTVPANNKCILKDSNQKVRGGLLAYCQGGYSIRYSITTPTTAEEPEENYSFPCLAGLLQAQVALNNLLAYKLKRKSNVRWAPDETNIFQWIEGLDGREQVFFEKETGDTVWMADKKIERDYRGIAGVRWDVKKAQTEGDRRSLVVMLGREGGEDGACPEATHKAYKDLMHVVEGEPDGETGRRVQT